METVALLYEDYQKELAEDFKNTFLKRASDTDSSRSNDTVIDEVTDMLSTNIAVYTEKLLQRWGFSSGGEGGGGGDVTVTLDDLLKKYLSDNYVTIKGDQEVFGEKDFRKGIRIAGRRLYWDEGNDALVIEGAAYTTRWLSAKGVSPGGGGAGSGGAAAMYQLIDVSPNDTKDAVLGAEKDYVLTFDGSFWRGMPNKGGLSSKLFTALDKEGNEVNPDDENAEIYAIRANYSLWSVGFLSAKGISDGGTGGGGGGAVALYQLLDVEKNADITGVAGATKGSVLTFNGDKWYADKPKTAAGISNLFTALDNDGNEVDLNDESKLGTITNIRANYALWSVDWISAKGKSSGGSGGGGGLINLVYGFESLGGTFDNNDNSATFNAFTINEIWKLASSGLTNVTVTGSGNAVTDVIKGSDGRSLTFTKGSTFATKSEFDALNTKFNDFLTGSDADDIINKWSELEVFLQGMKESDNLAVILQSKMDKTAFSKLFTALDASGNEVDPSDDTKTIASIRANFGFWGVDYISAKGVSKGSGGTGGASTLYQLVDVLANDTEDGVEGAAAGKALVFDGTHWRAGDAGLNESQLYSYLTANKYLTQSAADSRYVTSSRKVIAGTGLSGGGALTSDVTLSLGTSGVVAGTYTKVMVDAYGRVTSGTNLSATDIPNLDWSKITTGKPTTLAGYGITDAVTLTTAQTISGQKTFTKNILMNSGIGLSYGGNTVFRNTAGNTVISSYGNEGMIYFRPNGDTSDVGVIQINKQGHLNGVSAGFTGGVSAARLTANEYIQIGDAQLVYDSANKALRVKHRTDGNTVGFYSDGWVSALGVKTGGSGGGSGVIKTVYSFANLTDGTTFSDSDLDNTFNAYTIKKLYDMAGQGGLDADAMWAELKKADSSKIIDASHIPTSVLDGRWVTISTNQNITGQKTFTQQLKSTVATGTAPLIVNSKTLVSNLNSNYLQGYNNLGFIHSNYSASTGGTAYVSGDTHIMLVAEINIDTIYSTYVILLSNEFWGHQHYSALQLHIACTNNDNSGNKSPRCSVHVMSLVGSHARGVRYKIENNKAYIFIEVYGGNSYGRWASTILQNYDSITTNNANTTGNITLRFAFNQSNSGLSDASYVNYISSTGLATSRTLWGQPFNGTANVSGNMTGVGSINMSGQLTSTVASGVAPFIVVSNTVVGNLNADLLDGVHLAGFGGREGVMRSWIRGTYTTVNQYFGNGNVVTIDPKATDDATLSANTTVLSLGDSAIRNTQLAFHYDTNTIKYRRHDDSKWNDWVVLIHSGNYASYSDGRYVKKAGDTMTGDLAMDTNKGFYIPNGTRVVKTSGNWIHGGGDVASVDDANLRFGSWNGIGWYPTISGQTVAQGKNAMWLNVRNGSLDTHGVITSHNGYLAANWDSARRLVLGGGSTYAWIDLRNSSDNSVLNNIILYDSYTGTTKEMRAPYFKSTVGTGTQPYQCNSTTLNTNLNADLFDNWHLNFLPRNYNKTRTYAMQFALGSTDNDWKKIFACSESGTGPYQSVTVWGQIWYSYGNHANEEVRNYHFCAIFQMRSGETSSGSGVGILIDSARLYLPTFAKGMDNIRLVRVGTNNFELQVRQISSWQNGHIQYQYWAYSANVSAWESLQSTSNTSVAVSAGGASTLADSRASSADVLTTSRTLWGRPFNGSSNIDGNIDNAAVITSKGGIWLDLKGSSGVAFYAGGSLCAVINNTGVGIGTSSPSQKLHVAGNIIATGAITAKASSSDIRLKTDIQGYDAMGIIRKFRSVKYHWNAIAKENSEVFNHDNWNYGLIAQDLLSGGYTQWVKDIFNDYYTIDYERLIPVVWKGLQEVDDEVTKLKREVARLNKRVKELEKSLCA